MLLGVYLAFIYSLRFEGNTPKIGDSRDIYHAVCASATDALLTQDRRFRRLLARVPVVGFEVLDLRGLINQVNR